MIKRLLVQRHYGLVGRVSAWRGGASAVVSITLLFAPLTTDVRAQAVQATVHAIGTSVTESPSTSAFLFADYQALASMILKYQGDQSRTEFVQRLSDLRDQVAGILLSTDAADRKRLLESYLEARKLLILVYPVDTGPLSGSGRRAQVLAGITIPQAFTTMKDVVFTLGYELAVGKSAGTNGSVSLATNLLGAAAGAAFDAIGSTEMKNYLSSNIAAGTALPTGPRNSLTSFVGLGLGKVPLFGATLWPAINIEETDTADTRTPRELLSIRSDQKTWSAPEFDLGIVLPDGFISKLGMGKIGLIPTLGIKAPHYFPGDPFTALAALFSAKRSDYVRAGKSLYTFGLVIPIYKADAPSP